MECSLQTDVTLLLLIEFAMGSCCCSGSICNGPNLATIHVGQHDALRGGYNWLGSGGDC